MTAKDRAIENSGSDAHAWADHGHGQGGLTKREYIAAMAMQGLLASETTENRFATLADLAESAVQQADELLLALERIPEFGENPDAEHAPRPSDMLP